MALLRPVTTMPYAAGLALVLTLGACTGGGDPPSPTTPVVTGTATGASTTATSSSVPSTAAATTAAPTPSVDPVLAKIPAAARPETPEGSTAYIEFYVATLNTAFKVGDTTLLKALTKPGCKTCDALSGGAEEVSGLGRHYSGDLLRLTDRSPLQFTESVRTVLFDVAQMPVSVLDKDGKKVDTVAPGVGRYVATLDYDDRWIITRLQEAK